MAWQYGGNAASSRHKHSKTENNQNNLTRTRANDSDAAYLCTAWRRIFAHAAASRAWRHDGTRAHMLMMNSVNQCIDMWRDIITPLRAGAAAWRRKRHGTQRHAAAT